MANVLPLEAQKRVWALNRSRLILVTSLMLLGLAAAAALTLVPSYVALRIAAPPVPDTAVAVEDERGAADALERSHLLIRELRPVLASTSSPVAAAQRALEAKPAGVRITRVIYMEGNEYTQITLVGTGGRDQVSAYKDTLASSGAYDSVSVPVGALVGSEGGGFSIVLTGTF